MLKALFKKQMMEVNTWLIQDRKSGKRRSKSSMVFYLLFYLVIFAVLGSIFFVAATTLCAPLVNAGLGWLYFAMMGLIAVMLGVFGSVFNTYASLYKAKDNEFLLALPIPASNILIVRLFGVWMWSLIYEAIVFIPAVVVYGMAGRFDVFSIVCSFLVLLLLSVFILALSCVLGWVVAKISVRLKSKAMISALVSVLFLGAYYYIYFRANEVLQSILANAQNVSEQIKGAVYPVYWMGRACEGSFLSLLLFAGVTGGIFAVVYIVMSRSFFRMATTNRGTAKKKYKEKKAKRRSLRRTLLIKEYKRFVSSSTYMLNCGLGTLFLPVVGVLAILKADFIRDFAAGGMFSPDTLLLIGCAGICMMAAMNDITAPAISLEGSNLWIVQSLPVSSWAVLKAKIRLHLIFTEIPAAFCAVCLIIAVRPGLLPGILLLAVPGVFVLLSAAFGLMINLNMPNLKWTNEIIPIKQSFSVILAMFGSWGFVVVLAILYLAVGSFLPGKIYLLLCLAILCCCGFALFCWLKNEGTKIFEQL